VWFKSCPRKARQIRVFREDVFIGGLFVYESKTIAYDSLTS